jgi:hypothetical protein
MDAISVKKKWLYGIILVLAVAIAGVGGYPIFFTQCKREKFEPYVSTFHLLFEDGSHNLLGNLTGKIRITEPEKAIIHSICKLSLSSPRADEYHERAHFWLA